MDFDALLAELNIRIGDTNNFTFTNEEKESALTEAINDTHVVTDYWDHSLTFRTTTYQYAKPSGANRILDIYIRPDNTTATDPQKISSDLWEVVDSNIQFKNNANNFIPDGYTLYIKSKTKYTADDTIGEVGVREYVLNLAQLHCYKILLTKKNFSFLKNDTSVSEIVASKRELEREVERYRQGLPKAFENA